VLYFQNDKVYRVDKLPNPNENINYLPLMDFYWSVS